MGDDVGPITAAAVQFEPTLFDKAGNVDRLTELVVGAADAGAQLITTPEMAVSGYCFFDQDEAETMAEVVPGPTTAHFAAIAHARDCHLVIGMPERDVDTGLLYNSAVLIGPEGIIGVHRKTHSYIAEPNWAAPGNLGHQVFETPLGRISLLICMDIHFIETARIAALDGADVICHISNWLAERTPAPYWISRAYENDCYLIESNRWGLERGVQFSGGSCIIGPDGTIEACVDSGDGWALASLDIDGARMRRQSAGAQLLQRKPHLYRELQINSYLWNPRDFFNLYGASPLPVGALNNIAVSQFAPSEVATDNVATIVDRFRDAVRRQSAAMVVFPELSVTGPVSGTSAQSPTTVDRGELSGLLAPLLAATAAESAFMVVGFAEHDSESGALHNAAALLGPDGLVAVHRKIHLDPVESQTFAPGNTWTVADTPVGRVGILHGGDALIAESARILALRACDLLAVPAALTRRIVQSHNGTAVTQPYPIPTGASGHHWHHMRVRAGENNVYVAYANACGPSRHAGHSGIFGPDTFAFPRTETLLGPTEGTVTSPIDTRDGSGPYSTNVVRRKDLVMMRLSHHYLTLSAPDPNPDPSESPREGAEHPKLAEMTR